VRRLAEGADVLVENFRAGAMERFGLGVEALRAANPRLVWCTISGYDRAGPEAARPGYDLVIQGESGLMSINGEAGRPPLKFGVAAVDMFTGMSAAQAILAALFQAQRTGRGRRIDLALYDCGVMLGAYCALDALATGEDPPRYGNAHPSIVPYGVFEAADGPFVLTVGNDRQFRALCEGVLARPDLAADPRFAGNPERSRHRAALVAALAAEFAGRARAGILAGLAAAGIPCGEVLGLHEALSHPRSRAMVLGHAHPQAGEVRYLAPPWRFDGARPPASPPPGLGADTGEWRGAGES
jgi:crotonobetainyl-CoA:carnitine CoA-transferase CaiB-like acyl-CoA transferase